VAWLPQSLPDEPVIVWQVPTTGDGLSGVMATHELVVIADRDVTDSNDVFRCLDAETGLELWTLEYPALGKLDYGNSPRATPLLHDGVVYTLGAMGHLYAVELASGEVLWKKDLLAEFAGEIPIWGLSASPLIVDGQLIVTTGSEAAFLAALDPQTGRTLWTVAGRQPAYASFVFGTFAGRRQLIGYDKISLGGWDPQNGERLWELIPPEADDFNVPTPILVGEQLLVTTENNGTRLYDFERDGRLNPEPTAMNERLAPDTSTPVLTSGRVFGAWGRLYCLDARGDLSAKWSADDRAFRDYVSLIASPERVLVTTIGGELILLDARSDSLGVCGRQQVITDDSEVHSHPAIVGTKLFVRSASTMICIELRPDQSN
jgi:outer membrane protein assembly factor BamB